MLETNYFWQGGRTVEIKQDPVAVTIHAAHEGEARAAAVAAGVNVRDTEAAALGSVRAAIVGDRDAAMDRLRATRSSITSTAQSCVNDREAC
jgi:hypothetical protein